uniref:Uncharacterized protein n=1 Tax=Rhizophora mucronata TaxID=61149 RepID=A0A2P2IHA2_RHIMU
MVLYTTVIMMHCHLCDKMSTVNSTRHSDPPAGAIN